MNRSLRRLGQLLVVMGALLGAALGVALALVVDDAGTGRAVATTERERSAVLAAGSRSSRPPASRPTSTSASRTGGEASSNQRAVSGGRAGPRGHKTEKAKAHKGNRGNPGKGKDRPAKSRS